MVDASYCCLVVRKDKALNLCPNNFQRMSQSGADHASEHACKKGVDSQSFSFLVEGVIRSSKDAFFVACG